MGMGEDNLLENQECRVQDCFTTLLIGFALLSCYVQCSTSARFIALFPLLLNYFLLGLSSPKSICLNLRTSSNS